MPHDRSVYSEHRRQQFMRPDAHRFIRPDAYRFMPPGSPRYHGKHVVRYFWPKADTNKPQEAARRKGGRYQDAPAREDLYAESESERRALRHEIAKLRLDWELLKFALKGQKVFNPDQPRVPPGNPDGGQWTDSEASGGTSTDFSAARRLGSKPDGHHFVPHSIYTKMPLSDEARKVFDEAKTGRLRAQRHGRSKDHDVYNDAIKQKLEEYLAARNIHPEAMTGDQAREFVGEVLRSRDPLIRDFNLKIYRRELQYHLRRAPRRSD
jgi:hypothetical protein